VKSLYRDEGLSDEQNVAFGMAVEFVSAPDAGATLFIAGQAGAGKTHLLSTISRRFPNASQLAPIGKAAANLAARTGRHAETVHSFLYQLDQIVKDATGRPDMKWRSKIGDGEFARRLVLLDEAPIAGERVIRDLLATGCRIIAVGDPNQLRPVGQDPFFTDPDCVLTEPHRTALDSAIIKQAHRILQGLPYEADGDQFRVVPRAYDLDLLSADTCLCWTNNQRISLNAQIRALRGIRSPTPQAGEFVACRKNYRRGQVYKGAVYVLAEPFNAGDRTITLTVEGNVRTIPDVKFIGIENDVDADNANSFFDYGYAITTHSAAGSEWPNVLVFDNYPRGDADYGRWIYTAATRGSARVTVVSKR
jgi:exodeoxyribonuclease-5